MEILQQGVVPNSFLCGINMPGKLFRIPKDKFKIIMELIQSLSSLDKLLLVHVQLNTD